MKKLYSFSELTRFLSSKTQKELKQKGIILPVGDFHYLTKKAYLKTSNNWKESQKIFSEVSSICQVNKTAFILYKMPEFNLLDNNSLFSLTDTAISNYCSGNDRIIYLDGNNTFTNKSAEEFRLSKYDGHPKSPHSYCP